MLFKQSYANKINLLIACVFLSVRKNKNDFGTTKHRKWSKEEQQKIKTSGAEEKKMQTRISYIEEWFSANEKNLKAT